MLHPLENPMHETCHLVRRSEEEREMRCGRSGTEVRPKRDRGGTRTGGPVAELDFERIRNVEGDPEGFGEDRSRGRRELCCCPEKSRREWKRGRMGREKRRRECPEPGEDQDSLWILLAESETRPTRVEGRQNEVKARGVWNHDEALWKPEQWERDFPKRRWSRGRRTFRGGGGAGDRKQEPRSIEILHEIGSLRGDSGDEAGYRKHGAEDRMQA